MKQIIQLDMIKNWFITGVSTGFGKHLAELALQKGDKVAGTFRDQGQADEFSQKWAPNGTGLVADVTNESQVNEAIAAAIDQLGHLDVVVNNAGYGSLGPSRRSTMPRCNGNSTVMCLAPYA